MFCYNPCFQFQELLKLVGQDTDENGRAPAHDDGQIGEVPEMEATMTGNEAPVDGVP
jgi:hypothetical protein